MSADGTGKDWAAALLDRPSPDTTSTLTDPPLGVELSRHGGKWVDGGEPSNSLWDLLGSAGDGEDAQPLFISVGVRDGRPQWNVTYPSPDDKAREYDEVFTTRDELVAALDRLEMHDVE